MTGIPNVVSNVTSDWQISNVSSSAGAETIRRSMISKRKASKRYLKIYRILQVLWIILQDFRNFLRMRAVHLGVSGGRASERAGARSGRAGGRLGRECERAHTSRWWWWRYGGGGRVGAEG